MFVIVPFLKVRFNDHSAREILYVCPWAIQEMAINAAESRVNKKDLVFIIKGFIFFL
jgi:hypothetical protein